MTVAQTLVDYLRNHDLRLTTAESCTAGQIVTLLAEVPGSGSLIESGYVVYSPEAKQRLLGVSPRTIDTFNLTSREVAEEMALGALHDANANVAVATTGILGPDDMDGIPAGTVCFAWAFQINGKRALFSRQERFFGTRGQVQLWAAEHALLQLRYFHQRALAGEYR
ncbi:nicotinamide-nucleotide amidohydrolase family protein [Pseudomonas mediterranea]|uniref:CinA family protein n=1 Tax=Pseudomonas mediterranea TaxID=183795 RepID=UPI0006D8AFE8|nr:CinA family protein [Pseudomonas mediterranea]MBL0841490.1 CinA family protein [Pseudomonas mediterranea]QHA82695.1 nicotinamide-nucleotide amidohydrolase family protein [Pseudomonas mediterranea]UZE03529.1 CinA family protein [Pseudomonas mediterranea]CAH0124480.1 Nicotinamide-nucleotide amidohydrolase PncC [Pseudomonas mediterranea]